MKIYRVKVTCETVVRAENREEAEKIAIAAVKHEDDPLQVERVIEVPTLSDLPPGWDGTCIPWGGRWSPLSNLLK